MRLKDKTAIVTGGASGFGKGIVAKFIAEGAHVMIADRNSAAAHEVANELGGIAVEADVSDGDSVAAMAEDAKGAFGRIDILVNNAGITHKRGPMEGVTEDEFDRVFAVNCKSVYLTARSLVPIFRAQGSGVILNVA